jgi:regulator of sirC expression with transglutaminase-like and TPR domain
MSGDAAQAALAALGQSADPELMSSALLLAAFDWPQTDAPAVQARIANLAAQVQGRIEPPQRPRDGAQALAQVLAQQEGFNGDALSYDDPLNANFAAVMARRKGLPITLSMVYAAVGRAADLTVDILNTPLHVLIRVGGSAGQLLDPFGAGQLLSPSQATAMLAKLQPGSPPVALANCPPMSNRQALLRLQMNLASRAEAAESFERCLEIAGRMTLIAPQDTASWWLRLRMEWRLERLGAARESLHTLLGLGIEDRERIAIERMLGQISRNLN